MKDLSFLPEDVLLGSPAFLSRSSLTAETTSPRLPTEGDDGPHSALCFIG